MSLWDLVWAGWIIAFLALEFLALGHVVPWQTLSSTVWGLEKASAVVKILALAGLTILTAHIVWHFPD